MGDFGEWYLFERFLYIGEVNVQFLYEVWFLDFFMFKWKVSNDEYNVFVSQNNWCKVNDCEVDVILERIVGFLDSG